MDFLFCLVDKNNKWRAEWEDMQNTKEGDQFGYFPAK